MIGLLGSMSAVAYQRTIIDIEMMFGLFFIVTMTLNFQYGNAGVPNMACALSASVGGYVVSAIVTRLIFWIGMQAGLDILPARGPAMSLIRKREYPRTSIHGMLKLLWGAV